MSACSSEPDATDFITYRIYGGIYRHDLQYPEFFAGQYRMDGILSTPQCEDHHYALNGC